MKCMIMVFITDEESEDVSVEPEPEKVNKQSKLACRKCGDLALCGDIRDDRSWTCRCGELNRIEN